MKIVCAFLVLALCSAASAGLSLVMTGDPLTGPVTIGVNATADQLANVGLVMTFKGPQLSSIADAVNLANTGAIDDVRDATTEFHNAGYYLDADKVYFFNIAVLPANPPGWPLMRDCAGGERVVDGIFMQATGIGDITIAIGSPQDPQTLDPVVFDTMVVHIPEPMTVGLLGLGGLFLRRQRREKRVASR